MIQSWSKVLEDREHESKNRIKCIVYAVFKFGN